MCATVDRNLIINLVIFIPYMSYIIAIMSKVQIIYRGVMSTQQFQFTGIIHPSMWPSNWFLTERKGKVIASNKMKCISDSVRVWPKSSKGKRPLSSTAHNRALDSRWGLEGIRLVNQALVTHKAKITAVSAVRDGLLCFKSANNTKHHGTQMQGLIHVFKAALPFMLWPGWTEPIYSEMFVLIIVCCHPPWQVNGQ